MSKRARLLGFWSYSRRGEELSAILRDAMHDTLSEGLGGICDVDIFRDNDRQSGLSHGHDWARDIVAKLAGSALFFWNQTPRWVESAYCRFELEVFRANVQRMAAAFSTPANTIDADRMFERLIVPIRRKAMDEHQWTAQPQAVVSIIRPLWSRLHVSSDLNIVQGRSSAEDIRFRCEATEPQIRSDLFAALPPHVTLPQFLAFLGNEDAQFIRTWTNRLPSSDVLAAPAIPPALARQDGMAAGRTGGRAQFEDHALGICYFLVAPDEPGSNGFWASAKPVGGALAARIRELLPQGQQPRVGPDGQLVWSAEAAGAVRQMLAAERTDTDIPTANQAQALRDLDPAERARIGWQAAADNFWCATPDGRVVVAAASREMLPLMLTRDL